MSTAPEQWLVQEQVSLQSRSRSLMPFKRFVQPPIKGYPVVTFAFTKNCRSYSSMPVYLDYHAHSPIDPRVLDAFVSACRLFDANPHSAHLHGSAAYKAVEEGRISVGDLLGAKPSEIVFTSGATEANNLALLGLEDFLRKQGRSRVAISSIEHPSILQAAAALGERGFVVDILPVNRDGLIDLEVASKIITHETGVVSVSAANHEIGVIQPIERISTIARACGAIFHSDLAQMAGKRPVSLEALDLASFSGHKLCGPAGIGALYVKRLIKPKIKPLLIGGGQESGVRSGTVPAALCIAFGEACAIAAKEMFSESSRITKLRDNLLEQLLKLPGSQVNGSLDARLPGNINIRFDDVDGEALAFSLQSQISISTGSACNARSLEPSAVLLAMGLTKPQAESSVRIGIGRFTTQEEIDEAARAMRTAVIELRAIRSRL
ncbi:cysteine desulfurase family protein [Pseudomonas aeruginosa]|nr:cysteine desulfurase family protein [Pseudomonas aeruginosa]